MRHRLENTTGINDEKHPEMSWHSGHKASAGASFAVQGLQVSGDEAIRGGKRGVELDYVVKRWGETQR